ncbi:testis-specific serine kinase substrate-like [Scyliorhinus canicula]|uniref:testis-specific serine kinase substrate-like n=1 Tax=Scyliorhinus canicula TaxID=7830 RepID=UPI0018F4B5A1|nr:testis-specific serine kinase substrate-like [Scyliorhinus canicula]
MEVIFKTIWQSSEFKKGEVEEAWLNPETQQLSYVESEETLAVLNWLNNYTVGSTVDPLDVMWVGLKRTYGCSDISIKNTKNNGRKKNEEYDSEDVEASVDSIRRKAAAVRENSSLLELKLRQLCKRIKEDTMKKHKKLKADLSKKLRKKSLTNETGSSTYYNPNESLCQTLEYVVATMSDLEVMMTDMINSIEEHPNADRMLEKDPATSRKESETRNLPHKPKSLSSVLEEVRKTLVDFNSEYHQDTALTEEMFKQTDKVKEKMSNLLHQWEVSQEQESSLHKMLGDFRAETNDVSISMNESSEAVSKIAADTSDLAGIHSLLEAILVELHRANDLSQKSSYLLTKPQSGNMMECCFSAEVVQQVLKKSTSSIAEEIHRMEDSTYKEVKSWRQKVEDLRHQLHQEHFRCCTMESEIRLLRDEIMRLQKHLFYQQSSESLKKSDTEDIFRKICDICDRVQELSQGTSLSLQDKKSSFTVPSLHRARHSEELTGEFSGDN